MSTEQTITIEEAKAMVQTAVQEALANQQQQVVVTSRPRRVRKPGIGSELVDTTMTGVRTIRKLTHSLENGADTVDMAFDLAKMALESSYYEQKLEALDNKADFYSALTQRKQELIQQGMSEDDVNKVLN